MTSHFQMDDTNVKVNITTIHPLLWKHQRQHAESNHPVHLHDRIQMSLQCRKSIHSFKYHSMSARWFTSVPIVHKSTVKSTIDVEVEIDHKQTCWPILLELSKPNRWSIRSLALCYSHINIYCTRDKNSLVMSLDKIHFIKVAQSQ